MNDKGESRFRCKACGISLLGPTNRRVHRDGYVNKQGTTGGHKICPKRDEYKKTHPNLPLSHPEQMAAARAVSLPSTSLSSLNTLNPTSIHFRKSILAKLITAMTIEMRLPFSHLEHPAFKAVVHYLHSTAEVGSRMLVSSQTAELCTMLRSHAWEHFLVSLSGSITTLFPF